MTRHTRIRESPTHRLDSLVSALTVLGARATDTDGRRPLGGIASVAPLARESLKASRHHRKFIKKPIDEPSQRFNQY
ncbi:hypothetical protein [Mycobacterium sp. E2699]|uniref:hypothetical protein n=1 Tax=Mycobacterium sp. E2699 TaxID=1834137 RepID=UPI0012EAE95C|nr:hypothetical protein [Mycobacterium sp. E2699]